MMEDDKYKIQRIKITNLSLDLKNYRFNPQNSQREAIKEMLKGKGGEKLYRLAKDIVNEGLNPSDMLMIAPIEDETSGRVMYKVLEGNRRVTALKLLGIPELIEWPEFQSLKNKFIKLHKAYIENPVTSVVCVVFDNETDANLWIERKHAIGLQGEGTEMWDSTMRQRYEQATKGDKSVVLQTLDMLRNAPQASIDDMLMLEKLNNTNLGRLLEDPYVRECIGIAKRNKQLVSLRNRSEVETMLLSIVRDISRPDFKVAEIYNKELRKKYIDDLCQKVNIPNTPTDQEWKIDPESDNEEIKSTSDDAKTQKAKPKLRERTTLIPSGVKLPIPTKQSRAYDVFKELTTLSAKKYPNSVAVMFRVFLELSVDVYLETFNLLRDGQLTANESGTPNLQGNVNRVINDMVQKGFINKDLMKGIKSELNNTNSPLSIDSLNAYVHNGHFFPFYLHLLTGWDNVQPFFNILWQEISSVQKQEEK